MHCPICNQLNTCKVQNTMIHCLNSGVDKVVEGYEYLHPAVGSGKGWTWQLITVEEKEWQRKIDEENKHADKALILKRAKLNRGRTASTEVPEGDRDGLSFNQIAFNALYGDSEWTCFSNVLHVWRGNFYEPRTDDDEIPRIHKFCDQYSESKEVGKGKDKTFITVYPYAKPRAVMDVLQWAKMQVTVDMRFLNPPGINCTNGVVQIEWEDKNLKIKLVKHDSKKHFYVCKPSVKYDPEAPTEDYDRMMQCLEPGVQQIWERTVAASIDLATVRQYGSRTVKALFLKGDGSNGKDSLKKITQILFGKGTLAACSCTDWKQYDEGRYFTINSLNGKTINWPSENADAGRVDQLQGLKSAITGDEITFEAKGRDAKQGEPKAVFLFNVNESPNLMTHLKASESRWALIPFDKTYSSDPGTGELLADPRFKEDFEFLRAKVVPAFLNRLLKQLQNVVSDGIDYSPTKEAMDAIQMDNCHLYRFAADSGLVYDPVLSVTATEIWENLRQWYIDNGIATVEHVYTKTESKEKLLWVDQANKGDENVKAPHQVISRFLQAFPKAKKGSYADANRNQKPLIRGLGFRPDNLPGKLRDDEVILDPNFS